MEEISSPVWQRKLLSTQAKFFKNIITVLLILLAGCAPVAVATKIPVNQTPTLDPAITNTPAQVQTETPSPDAVAMTDIDILGCVQVLEGPDIKYNNIRFTLEPAIGSRLYVFDDVTSINGLIAHHIRFSLTMEEYCQTWCLEVYPIAEFEQAFGFFVFPPAGYRGGAAVIFEAQEMALSFRNGSGNRGLETFGQSHYGVSNESLKYIFRGYTADKQYGIYIQSPIHAANLPVSAPTMTTNVEDILEYNRQAAESMNALTPADFTPTLDLLDALVASIHVGPR